jgi:hypothetical protein
MLAGFLQPGIPSNVTPWPVLSPIFALRDRNSTRADTKKQTRWTDIRTGKGNYEND